MVWGSVAGRRMVSGLGSGSAPLQRAEVIETSCCGVPQLGWAPCYMLLHFRHGSFSILKTQNSYTPLEWPKFKRQQKTEPVCSDVHFLQISCVRGVSV